MDDLLDLKRTELIPSKGYYDENASVFKDFGENESRFDVACAIYNSIHNVQQAAKDRFVTLGEELFTLQEGQFYIYVLDRTTKNGYVSFFKFCNDCFGFKKRTVIRLISVYKTYFLRSGKDEAEKYKKYSFRQLVEMIPLGEYRYRVNETIPTRDIKKLAELYKEYTPRPEDTVSHDLEVWKQWHEEKLKKSSDKKEALFFTPKSKEVSEDEEGNYDSEEKSATSTPSAGLSYNDIVRGINGLLDKLVSFSGAWQSVADSVKEALETKTPLKIVTRKHEAEAVQKVFNDPRFPKKRPLPAKVTLNNDKERKEFIKSAKDWPIWFEIPEFDMSVRRKDFINGDSIIALIYNEYYDYSSDPDKPYEVIEYHLITSKRNKFGKNEECESSLLKYLSEHRKDI